MYIPEPFRKDERDTLLALMRARPFAILVSARDGLIASHIPLVVEAGEGPHGTIYGHLAGPNPQALIFDGQSEALAIFAGPHAYVSPSWYEAKEAVPTWNYAAVHAYGRPVAISEPTAARAILARLVETFESEGTGPWRMDDLPEAFVSRMVRGIAGFRMPIERLEGKFKLSQNRPEADRRGVVRALAASSDPEARAVALLMEAERA